MSFEGDGKMKGVLHIINKFNEFINTIPLWFFILLILVIRFMDILTAYIWYICSPESFLKHEGNEVAVRVFYYGEWHEITQLIVPFIVVVFIIVILGYLTKSTIHKYILFGYSVFGISAILCNICSIFTSSILFLHIISTPLDILSIFILILGLYFNLKGG